jgi:hypothetical protein
MAKFRGWNWRAFVYFEDGEYYVLGKVNYHHFPMELSDFDWSNAEQEYIIKGFSFFIGDKVKITIKNEKTMWSKIILKDGVPFIENAGEVSNLLLHYEIKVTGNIHEPKEILNGK